MDLRQFANLDINIISDFVDLKVSGKTSDSFSLVCPAEHIPGTSSFTLSVRHGAYKIVK